MTLTELIEWLFNQKYKDQEDENDPQINKPKAKRDGAQYIDPGMILNYKPTDPIPFMPSVARPIPKVQPTQIQRRGTLPKPNMEGWEGMLYELENPDKHRKF